MKKTGNILVKGNDSKFSIIFNFILNIPKARQHFLHLVY